MFKHCKEQKISYISHMKQALGYFWIIQKAAVAVLIHSVLPCCFQTYASKKVSDLATYFSKK
jgi:hypothetical protein